MRRRQRAWRLAQPRPGPAGSPDEALGRSARAAPGAPRPPFWRPAGWVGAAVRRRAAGYRGRAGAARLLRPAGPRERRRALRLCGRRAPAFRQVRSRPSGSRALGDYREFCPRKPLFSPFLKRFFSRGARAQPPGAAARSAHLTRALAAAWGELGGWRGQPGSVGRRVSPPRSPFL